jgi:hypothetical protein
MTINQESIIIFKNDAVGDLTQTLPAINNIINNNQNTKIIIYLSERSKNFSFLINNNFHKNIIFKMINYNLSFFEKLKIFFFISFNKISNIYILTPKNFYFYLPLLFQKIKFYAVCINGPNNYKRPNNFLRNFLFKYKINDRGKIFKRPSIVDIQMDLTKQKDVNDYRYNFYVNLKISDLLKKYIPKNYVYFHIKKSTVDKLEWGISELDYLFTQLLNYYDNVVFTKDIEKNNDSNIYKDKFNSLDFLTKKFEKKNNKIFFFDNIEGQDLYNTIMNSSKIVAFHGMMTNIGSLNKKMITDLWDCDIKNWNDYRNYRNALYEFKPVYKGYNFIIPSKNIQKTFSKIKFSLKKVNE